ncbi:phage tail assembly chaperone [Tumebacillus lipolyticus]|uniref:Phage portal protein n=1 Tax=Tumebacillus lipolyticus TaxID=1280370 RepID=A0ABW4ZX51_9BACL
MSELSMFFAENVLADGIEELVVSERFKDSDGKPIPWKLRWMTEAENEEIRKSATKRVKVKGQYVQETSPEDYMAKLVVSSVVFPDLKNAALQNSYGAVGADNLLRKMLLPGEYARLIEKVQEINGFDKDLGTLIDEVKN